MSEEIKELRQIAEEAKEASAWNVKPIIERFVDRAIDQLERLSLAIENNQGVSHGSKK